MTRAPRLPIIASPRHCETQNGAKNRPAKPPKVCGLADRFATGRGVSLEPDVINAAKSVRLATREVREHRWTVDALENKPVYANLEDSGHGEPMSTRMQHDRRFPRRVTAVLEPAEHPTVTQIEHFRSAACGNQMHPTQFGSVDGPRGVRCTSRLVMMIEGLGVAQTMSSAAGG
jgi:hypothetical protein